MLTNLERAFTSKNGTWRCVASFMGHVTNVATGRSRAEALAESRRVELEFCRGERQAIRDGEKAMDRAWRKSGYRGSLWDWFVEGMPTKGAG